jgi:hypothetical protein
LHPESPERDADRGRTGDEDGEAQGTHPGKGRSGTGQP